MKEPIPAAPGRSEHPPAISREILAEAAAWVTRLHGPSRSRQMELDCLAWQASSAANRLAFERCTETWQEVGNLRMADAYGAATHERDLGARRTRRARRVAVVLSIVLLAVGTGIGVDHWLDRDRFATGVGEQRSIRLDDGTRLTLNTLSRVRVTMSPSRRVVEVERGEALFEVAKDPDRPFVVQVSQSEIVALGTAFVVRHPGDAHPDLVTVTLLEGGVSVQPAADAVAGYAPVAMRPGDRLRIREARRAVRTAVQPTTVDRPPLEQALAWKRNEAVFEKATLAEAVAEVNRYSDRKIRIADDLRASDRRVSGVFRTGDTESFARAVAMLHGLAVRPRGDGWELAAQSSSRQP